MRVLIADDDPVSLHLLQRTLSQWGYDVTAARDGLEAWSQFRQGDFPVVITDWVMPGLDGLELVRRIRTSGHEGYVFIILLAASSNRHEVLEGMAAGADDFVVKPFDRNGLLARLRAGERVLRLEAALVEQNRLLRERNEQMEAELRMACEVQQALLPQGFPSFPAHAPPERSALRFVDRYLPTGAVGGDFFDVLALSDTRAGVFLCDVIGHGVRAALVTATVRALLGGLTEPADDPGRLLAQMNSQVQGLFGQANVPVFLSAVHAVIDTRAGLLLHANAGHPCPLLVRRGEQEVTTLLPAGGQHGPPLGVRAHARYPVAQTTVRPGDLLMLHTDGLYEASGAAGEPFGEVRLLDAVRDRQRLPAGRLFDELLAEVRAFTGGRGFSDDVCLLGVEVIRTGDEA